MFYFHHIRKLLELAWKTDSALTAEIIGELLEVCERDKHELARDLLHQCLVQLGAGGNLDTIGDERSAS